MIYYSLPSATSELKEEISAIITSEQESRSGLLVLVTCTIAIFELTLEGEYLSCPQETRDIQERHGGDPRCT